MRRRLPTCLILVPVVLAMAGFDSQESHAQSAPATFEIDGSVEPQLIPQWMLWQQSFITLDRAKRRDFKAFSEGLVLSAAESRILYEEAALEETRQGECRKAWDLEYKVLVASQTPEQQMLVRLREARIACRQKTLDARDRVLTQLGPGARASLLQWVERMRPDIRYFGTAQEKEYFWLPG
jgi:hypothetical protein